MRIIAWGREGNTFLRQTRDCQDEIRVVFKARNHVSITIRSGEKHLQRELFLRYGRAPHVGMLSEAVKLWERLSASRNELPAKKVWKDLTFIRENPCT